MGNCDTHLFLGSNSYKTLEYFSKQLGEKTIERDSVSINRDRQNWKTGKSVSDQVMARALMTPDELRRLDNDLCIIFEKGIKPVKANKFYYFKHPMAKKMAEVEISHNDIGEKDRGTWRKFNPYNPYVEDKKEEKAQDLKIESLDDLFEDDEEPKKEEEKVQSVPKEQKTQKMEKEPIKIKEFSNVEVPKSKKVNENNNKNKKEEIQELNLEDFDDAPILPQEDEQADEYDLQKELEAKFDELFGDTNGDGA